MIFKTNIIYLFLSGSFLSCVSNSQEKTQATVKIDSSKFYITRSVEIYKLGQEGADYIIQAMQFSISDSIKAKPYFRKALDKFQAALALDTSQKVIGRYIPDLYSRLNMPDSAKYWKEWLGKYYP